MGFGKNFERICGRYEGIRREYEKICGKYGGIPPNI